MDINSVINEYDGMFGVREPREILSYLMQKIDMSREEKDVASEIILLNETIGFCRDAFFKEEGVRYARELEHLMNELDFGGRIEYATTMLNLANAYRGFGMYEESSKRYDVCEELYLRMLPEGDFLFAGLYNNRGLLHQEMKDWDAAIEDFRRALAIADKYPEKEIEQALNELQSYVEDLIQKVFVSGIKTWWEYNEKNPDYRLSYKILVLFDVPEQLNDKAILSLEIVEPKVGLLMMVAPSRTFATSLSISQPSVPSIQ